MALRAGFHGTVGQPSAQVIDGSLKFAGGTTGSSNQYLEHTFISNGNRRTFTMSFWLKRSDVEAYPGIFFCGSSSVDPNNLHMYFNGDTLLLYSLRDNSNVRAYNTSRQFRDTSGWYHIVVAVDSTISSPALDRFKVYVNGDRVTEFSSSNHNAVDQNTEFRVNESGKKLEIGLLRNSAGALSYTYNGNMSQWYFIDGAALGPENFGFTDPLTNTWRPKKYNHRTDLYGVTWSSALVGDASGFQSAAAAADGFNGKVGTDNNSYAQNNSGSDPSTITFTPVGGIKFNSSIQVYLINAANTVNVNGEGAQTIAANEWVTVKTGSGTLNTLVFSRPSANGASFGGIRIDGHILIDAQVDNSFYLPMDGNSPIGQDKSGAVTPNNGSIWSASLSSSSGFRSSEPATNAFDGGTSSICSAVGSGTITFTSPVTFASNSTIRVFLNGGDHTVTVNGGSNQTISAGSFQTVTYSNSGNSNFVMTFHRGGGADTGVRAIEINGVILVDGKVGNSSTPVNFGGSNSVDRATGALPILEGPGGAVANVGVRTDAYASSLVLALPLVGNKEDVVTSINSAQTNVTVTNNGSVPFQTTQSNFYGGSAFFEDSSSDNLTFTNFGSRFEFTGDYTIEAWIYPTDSGAADGSIFVEHDGSSYFAFNFDPGTQFNIYNNSGSPSWSPSTNLPPANKWSHIALVRSGSTQTIYVNGNSIATNTASGTHGYASPTYARIGGGASGALDSYIQDLRVYKGVAKYTENFIPASTNPDILPDTPSGVSGSSKLTKITDGAVSFDGSGDYLDVGSGSDYQFGTGDFTFEGYFYANNFTNRGTFIDGRDTGNTTGLTVGHEATSGQIRVYMNASDGSDITVQSDNFSTNKWTHVAVSRDSGTVRLFIDGILQQSATRTNDLSNTNNHRLGYKHYSTSSFNYFDGFISNVRIVKGTALYTSRFTPPTEPLTNVTNTKLLCCTSSTSGNLAAVSPATFSNDGTVWSSGVTFSPSVLNADRGADKAFNGTISNNASTTSNNPALLTASFSTNLTSVTSLRIYSGSNSSNAYINGASGSTVSITANNWTDLTSLASGASGTISSISVVTAGDNAQLAAVEVNGCILVDGLVGEALLRAGDAAATNFNPFNTDINTIRGQETGYPTWSPLVASTSTLSNGNLKITTQASDYVNDLVTMRTPAGTGKWYWEFVQTARTGTDYTLVGMLPDDNTYKQGLSDIPQNCGGIGLYIGQNGVAYVASGAATAGTTTATFDVGDLLGWAFDAENGTVKCFKNGVPQGTQFTNVRTDTGWTFCVTDYDHTTVSTFEINFGQKPFKFSPPDGYQSLNAANVRPSTVIARPDQYVGVTTYTSNNNTLSVSDYKFQPDLLIFKNRDTANHWGWFDSVRGANKQLSSNRTREEITTSGSGYGTGTMNSFDPFGFTLGDDVGSNVTNYPSGNKHVAYGFKAGGNKNTFNIDDVGYANASDVNMAVGDLNSVTFDKSQNWTSQVSGTQNGTYPFSNMFNADGEATHSYPANGTRATFTPSPSFSNARTVKVWYYGPTINADTFKLNGVNVGDQMPTTSGTLTKTFNVDGFTSWSWSKGIGGDDAGMLRIDVDGVQLVDSGVTTPNVPSVALSKASVGTKQGFSIVEFNSQSSNGNYTVPHGLNNDPNFILMKSKTRNGGPWWIYHSSATTAVDLYLSFTSAEVTDNIDAGGGNVWGSSLPTNTTFGFTTGTGSAHTQNETVIAYCWHDVPGLQKFGSYVGSSGKTFVELGFRPALLVIKFYTGTDVGSHAGWKVVDNQRNKFNISGISQKLALDVNETENGGTTISTSEGKIDFLSNGFRILDNHAPFNSSGRSYIYMAWAEAPTVNLYGGQSNAR